MESRLTIANYLVWDWPDPDAISHQLYPENPAPTLKKTFSNAYTIYIFTKLSIATSFMGILNLYFQPYEKERIRPKYEDLQTYIAQYTSEYRNSCTWNIRVAYPARSISFDRIVSLNVLLVGVSCLDRKYPLKRFLLSIR